MIFCVEMSKKQKRIDKSACCAFSETTLDGDSSEIEEKRSECGKMGRNRVEASAIPTSTAACLVLAPLYERAGRVRN